MGQIIKLTESKLKTLIKNVVADIHCLMNSARGTVSQIDRERV
jgi:hypothetical protein